MKKDVIKCSYTKTTKYYVGKAGNKYLKSEYSNHGEGGVNKWGFKDLPYNEYPYTIEYKIECIGKYCEYCNKKATF